MLRGFKIGRRLALTHSESCLGLHTANLEQFAPRYVTATWNCQILANMIVSNNSQMPMSPAVGAQVTQSVRSQTISYALCDSPAGLLAYIVDAIGPPPNSSSLQPNPWSHTTLVNWAMLHWLPGPEVALHWLDSSAPMANSLWGSFSNVPLAISQYADSSTIQSAPGWAEQFHPVAMVRHRAGAVRFPAWERPGEIVQDIRDFAQLLRNSDLITYDMYTAGFDQTQY